MDANVRLAEVGEDGENEYGVGMEVKKLDLVRLKDRKEEAREGRNKAGVECVEEDGVIPRADLAAAGRNAGGTELVGVGGHQVPHLRNRRRADEGLRHCPPGRGALRRRRRRACLHRGLAFLTVGCSLGGHGRGEELEDGDLGSDAL